MRIERDGEVLEFDEKLPLLPLRDVVLFPQMTVPLLVGRVPSVNAIEEAVAGNRILFATAQRKPDVVDPQKEDLYRLGTIVRVLQLFRLPDGTMRVLVEGLCRARVRRFLGADDYYLARVEVLEEPSEAGAEIEAVMRAVAGAFNEYVHLNRRISDEVLLTVNNITDPAVLSYTVASHLQIKVAAKQEILELDGVAERLAHLSQTLQSELEIVKLERKIEGQVRSQVHKNQKEFYLNEQLKAIRKELGYQNEFAGEIEDLERQLKKAQLPKEVREKAEKELDRLSKMSFMSPEATVLRTYLDWLVAVPWKKRSEDNLDLAEVRKIMDADHYGLKKVKERILEYLAVVKLSGQIKGPILCFVGPPGVGKTSLGMSIARAMGRKFVRMSLGGVRDEAEIRGHRRTYIGSMPGRIVQAMKRAGVVNPLILLDEVDKLGSDWRGDPAAALLEVLDPEQNSTFNDHYLEVDYDLSQVLFITTANYRPSIPPPLLDRMETIELSGYLQTEKLSIAREFLLPKQIQRNGLAPEDMVLGDAALNAIIAEYTREAGVRSLEREISAIARKIARHKAEGTAPMPVKVTGARLTEFLGPPRYIESPARATLSRRDRQRPRLDGSGRRRDDDRGDHGTGEGNPEPHRKAGRGHARVRGRRDDLCPQERGGLGPRQVVLSGHRYPHPCAGGGDPEGRSLRGHHHGRGAGVRPDRRSHPSRCGHDRRDHLAGHRASDRGPHREGGRGQAGGREGHHHPQGQRQGPGRDSDQSEARTPLH